MNESPSKEITQVSGLTDAQIAVINKALQMDEERHLAFMKELAVREEFMRNAIENIAPSNKEPPLNKLLVAELAILAIWAVAWFVVNF